MSDQLHREVVGTALHLAPFVRERGARYRDDGLGAEMRTIRALATLGRAAREQVGINVRQPLSRMVCVAPGVRHDRLGELFPVLRAELNVKQVDLVSSGDALVTLEAKPNFRALGKKFGKKTPLAAEAVSAFTSEHPPPFQQGPELAVPLDR